MSVVLFKLVNGKPKKELCDPLMLDGFLKSGYSLSSGELLKQDKPGNSKLTDAEIKSSAKLAGIRVSGKSIKTLKEELNL